MTSTPSSASASGSTSGSLTDAEFHAKSHAVLDLVESQLDRWLDEDVVDIDGQRSGGLLEMRFPDTSVIVVNTQPPLHELWLAAQAGGYHFKYVSGQWRSTRDDTEFFSLLSSLASQQAGVPLTFARD